MPSCSGVPSPVAHDAGVGEAHERDEQADADGDAGAQRARHRAEDGLPEPGQHQDQDDDALPHDQAHGLRPGHLGGDDVGEHRVEAQAGGQAEREAADDTHDDRHDARDQRGGGRDHRDRDRDVGIGRGQAADEVACLVGRGADDERVEGDDVGHREEGHEATTHLLPDARPALGDSEPAVEAGLWRADGRRSAGGHGGNPRGSVRGVPRCLAVADRDTTVTRLCRGTVRQPSDPASRRQSKSRSSTEIVSHTGRGRSTPRWASTTSECAPQPWSTETTWASLGENSLAQAPKVRPSEPDSRTQ
jgi:hypothetical protein